VTQPFASVVVVPWFVIGYHLEKEVPKDFGSYAVPANKDVGILPPAVDHIYRAHSRAVVFGHYRISMVRPSVLYFGKLVDILRKVLMSSFFPTKNE
jgi:hypothetical protein